MQRLHVLYRLLTWIMVGLFITTGCSDPDPTVVKQLPKKRVVGQDARVDRTVAAATFESTEAAFAALVTARAERKLDDQEQAVGWLFKKGAAAFEYCASIGRDTQQPTSSRVAACNVLAEFGQQAIPVLLELTRDSEQQIVMSAVERVSLIKPPTKEIVDRYIELLDSDDWKIQLITAQATRRLGVQGGRTADQLEVILQDDKKHQLLRDAARKALRSVEPRRTLE